MDEENADRPDIGYSSHTYYTSLEDIRNFRGTRATAIFDNHSFWKRTLNAYGKEYQLVCRKKEDKEQEKRISRIRSAPISSYKQDKKCEKQEQNKSPMSPRRCFSATDYNSQENRASKLRHEYLKTLRSMNAYTEMSTFDDYSPEARPHRPSNSARYPRRIQSVKSYVDPEWDPSEYDVFVFHSKADKQWVESWIKNTLEARRYNVKMNSTREDLLRFVYDQGSLSRLVFILSPDMVNGKLKRLPLTELKQDIRKVCSVLIIKIRPCDTPESLTFTNYMDVSFYRMDDLTLQYRLLSKLISTLQLPKPVCS